MEKYRSVSLNQELPRKAPGHQALTSLDSSNIASSFISNYGLQILSHNPYKCVSFCSVGLLFRSVLFPVNDLSIYGMSLALSVLIVVLASVVTILGC